MTPKPRTKRFLGRKLHRKGDKWQSCAECDDGWTMITIGEDEVWGDIRVSITMTEPNELRVHAPTERAARNAMVRKLRRLRDELSELEF